MNPKKPNEAATATKAALPVASAAHDIYVSFRKLSEHGIDFTRPGLHVMVTRGLFPAPVQLSPNKIAWKLSDLIAWKASRPDSEYWTSERPWRPARERA